MQFAPQAAMKAYYWSDLSGYVISDKSMSHRTKISQKGWILIHIRSQIFPFIFHRFWLSSIPPPFFFKANIYFQRWETEIPPFLFLFCNWKVMDQNCINYWLEFWFYLWKFRWGSFILFKFIHLWFLLMKYKWIKIETVSSLSLSNLTGNAKST